jgi:hypothetical protein
MKRRFFVVALLAICCDSAHAAPKTYKYRCPKCGLVQEYTRPGTKKCPNDGRNMLRVY